MKRDRRRWIYADFDPKDEALSKNEFKQFMFPETSIVWVAETHEVCRSGFRSKTIHHNQILKMH